MLAYHNDPSIKTAILAQLARHLEADEIVKGRYWENGKGCAVGCTLYSGNHAEYETRFGIPQMLARFEDAIFEGLPNNLAKEWPERFMSAIEPGADLSLVGWKFLHWLTTDEEINPGINDEQVRDAVKQCADVLLPLTRGEAVSKARSVWVKARTAESAATWAPGSMAAVAASTAWAAMETVESVQSAKMTWAAIWAAHTSRTACRGTTAKWLMIADKLIELIREARKLVMT